MKGVSRESSWESEYTLAVIAVFCYGIRVPLGLVWSSFCLNAGDYSISISRRIGWRQQSQVCCGWAGILRAKSGERQEQRPLIIFQR